MVTHAPVRAATFRTVDCAHSLLVERDLAEATTLLQRLLAAEDRMGLVFPVMDDARRFLARRRRSLG